MANFKTSKKILSNDTQVKEETQQLGQGGGAEEKQIDHCACKKKNRLIVRERRYTVKKKQSETLWIS